MKLCYLAFGANIGDRRATLQKAIHELQSGELVITRLSPVYETEPMYVTQQPSFLNLVAEARTTLFPRQLLHRARQVEQLLGRRRLSPNGPRTIDIDVLLYGPATVMSTEELILPHPRLHERRFVLEPLAALAPDLRHPLLRRTIAELLPLTLSQQLRPAPVALSLP